jgi:hypothetical protein
MTCHRIFQDRQECITVIGITSGGYPARDNSGRRVLSAQQVVDAVGITYLAARIDRLRAPRNALLDHERSARNRCTCDLPCDLNRRWRTVAALDRVLARPNAIEDLAITGFELSRAAWWRANSSVSRFQTLRTLGRERLAVELQSFACVSICFGSATRDSRCSRDIVICFSRRWARPAGHAEKLISQRLVHGDSKRARS